MNTFKFANLTRLRYEPDQLRDAPILHLTEYPLHGDDQLSLTPSNKFTETHTYTQLTHSRRSVYDQQLAKPCATFSSV
jgi:hypothetical protein